MTNNQIYENLAKHTWKFIKNNIVDKREGSEWFWSLDKNNKPNDEDICEPWKISYHNVRACLELIERGYE